MYLMLFLTMYVYAYLYAISYITLSNIQVFNF